MIIGIEAERANAEQKTGVEHYAKQLILHLAKIDSQNTYILYLRTPPQQWFLALPANFKIKILPFPIFWTQLRLSWELFWHKVDVFYVLASAMPLIHPKNSFSTIHDIAWDFYPEAFTWFTRNYLKVFTWYAIKSCKKVIAVSESTKKDILKKYNISPEKVAVVYHGYEEQPVSLNLNIRNLPRSYVLFLSTLQPRKNLINLIYAFKRLKTQNPEIEQKLVVVGKPGWKYEEILKCIKENSDIVAYLNYVSDGERLFIISGADCLVLPSFYEGFGMQILEAFNLGTPVATSNISSMPEIAGEAAIYFSPNNQNEIASAIKAVLMDKALAENLKEKGKQRLKNFSWEECARQTLKVLLS